jgi:hypothetical protein
MRWGVCCQPDRSGHSPATALQKRRQPALKHQLNFGGFTMKFLKMSKLALALAAGALGVSTSAFASTYQPSQDTYIYEFLGNQGSGDGDSGGILTWNHESNHGAKGLVQFDSAWMSDAALSGAYTATLNLYAVCEPSGFVGACPGYADVDSPGGIGTTTTDVLIQGSTWTEAGALVWANITQTSTPFASFTQNSSAAGWVSVDVTSLIAAILGSGTDFGFSLSQENYPVTRADNGSVMVSTFCDSESSAGLCAGGSFKPYLEISTSPVPVPAAVWLFGSGLLGLVGVARRKAG